MTKEEYQELIYKILTSDDQKLDEMCWIKTIDYNYSEAGKIKTYSHDFSRGELVEETLEELDKPISTRMAILSRLTGKPYSIERSYSNTNPSAPYFNYKNQIISWEDMTPEQKKLAEVERNNLETRKEQVTKDESGKVFLSGYSISNDIDISDIAIEGFEKGEFFSVEIDISMDELLKTGIDPEEIGWKSLEQIKEEQIQAEEETSKQEIREILLNGDSEIGYVATSEINHVRYAKKNEPYIEMDDIKKREAEKNGEIDFLAKKDSDTLDNLETPPVISRAMPKKLFELGTKYGIGFPNDIRYSPCNYETEESYKNEFIPYDHCSENAQKEIQKRENALAKFKEKVDKDNTGKYDRIGKIAIPRYETNDNPYSKAATLPKAKIIEFLEFEVTQRELAEAGILPEDFKWMEKARVSPEDIAKKDNDEKLTSAQLMPLEKKGLKKWIEDIKAVLKKITGKGEK